ncbi:hypothetical protein HZC09_04675 [Candidatus Micrarchaeota archaeon]|nr:hypothetical protein [Candidatus Micrarchaeota archaeon]
MFWIFVLLLLGNSQALTMGTNVDALKLSGTIGEIYAYADQPAAFSVSAPYSIADIKQAGDNAKILLSAPQCLYGTEEITIVAANGTQSAEKKVYLTHEPRYSCENYIFARPQVQALSIQKSMVFSSEFDPTKYSLEITVPLCAKAKVGDTVVQKIGLLNAGASGTFVIQAEGEHAFLGQDAFNLQAREATEFPLIVKGVQSGRKWIELSAMRGRQVVSEARACVEFEDVYKAELNVPKKIEAKQCGFATIDAVIENKGTGEDSYTIKSDYSAPVQVTLKPGDKAKVDIPINASLLRLNENVVVISAISRNVEAVAAVVIDVKPCEPLVVAQISSVYSADGNEVNFTVEVTNEQDTPLRDVSIAVEGIPAEWKVSAEKKTIAPHSKANVTAAVLRTTEAEASPKITLYSGDSPITQKSLEKIPAKPSLTGRIFEGAADNAPWLVLAILVLVAAFMFVRTSHIVSEHCDSQDDREKLGNIKDEVTKEGYVEKFKP